VKNKKSENLNLETVVQFLNQNKNLFFVLNKSGKSLDVKHIQGFSLRESQLISITTT